jgi:hypothetical protein
VSHFRFRTFAQVVARASAQAVRGGLLFSALLAVCAHPSQAQDATDEETGGPGRVRASFGGEVTGTFSGKESGYFNYTDYENSLLRLFTATLDGALRVGDRTEILGEFRVQNRDATASGLYVRYRPWRNGPLAIQAGRIPPVFGRFSRRGYGQANPLIGVPLAYQYLTTLRATEVPWDSDALLAMRGRGWLVGYPRFVSSNGHLTLGPGLPLVSSMRWDTGVQAHADLETVTATVALTNGSLSNPRLDDDNGGKQVAARVTWQPKPPVNVGVSFSRGAFLADGVTNALPPTTEHRDYVQTAAGIDAEVSAGYWVVRGEAIFSQWRLPELGVPVIARPLGSTALTVEGRYRLTPAFHVAARTDRLLFSEITGQSLGQTPTPWDAPISRVEIAAGYSITRNWLGKVAWQYNWRDGVPGPRPRPREAFLAVQVSAWF